MVMSYMVVEIFSDTTVTIQRYVGSKEQCEKYVKSHTSPRYGKGVKSWYIIKEAGWV